MKVTRKNVCENRLNMHLHNQADSGWTSAAAAKRPAAPPAQAAGSARAGPAIQCPPAGRYMGKTANFQPIYKNMRYNPAVYDLKKPNARFFVIKSIGEVCIAGNPRPQPVSYGYHITACFLKECVIALGFFNA
jgi:hypothetical protein